MTRNLLRDALSICSARIMELHGGILRFAVLGSGEFMAWRSSWFKATMWCVMDIASRRERVSREVIKGIVEFDVRTGYVGGVR